MEEKPITSALDAVRYAMRTSLGPTDWPRFIHVDGDQKPLGRSGGGTGLIVVQKRTGDPMPTDADIKTAEATRAACDTIDRDFIDYIIIGTGEYYSFADERKTAYRLTPIRGEVIPVPPLFRIKEAHILQTRKKN